LYLKNKIRVGFNMYSEAFKNGTECALAGKSIHYNPFRNKGTADQFNDWVSGYNRCQRNIN